MRLGTEQSAATQHRPTALQQTLDLGGTVVCTELGTGAMCHTALGSGLETVTHLMYLIYTGLGIWA